jgi:hypothetical protein
VVIGGLRFEAILGKRKLVRSYLKEKAWLVVNNNPRDTEGIGRRIAVSGHSGQKV